MSRDVLIRGDVVIFIERSESDATGIPTNASLITENDWKAIIGEPSEGSTFEELELDYIKNRGWKIEQ